MAADGIVAVIAAGAPLDGVPSRRNVCHQTDRREEARLEATDASAAMKVVIVGGVAGGASCAARLRRLDERARIILVERGPFVSYANCGLPYYVGGVISRESSLLVADERVFREQFAIDVRTRCEAISISPRAARCISAMMSAGSSSPSCLCWAMAFSTARKFCLIFCSLGMIKASLFYSTPLQKLHR